MLNHRKNSWIQPSFQGELDTSSKLGFESLHNGRPHSEGLYWNWILKALAGFRKVDWMGHVFRKREGRSYSLGQTPAWTKLTVISDFAKVQGGAVVAPNMPAGNNDGLLSTAPLFDPGLEETEYIPHGRSTKNGSIVPVEKNLAGKRVAVVVYSYYPTDPRPQRAAEAFVQEGAEVDFFCLRRNREEPKRESANGVNVFRVSLKRQRGGKFGYLFRYSLFILDAFAFLTRRSFQRRYDLVHVHNMPDVLVFSALIPKLLGAKIILDLHDPMPELMQAIFKLGPESRTVRVLKHCEKWSIEFADLVLTPNVALQRVFNSRSCPPDKLQIVMNTPDEAIFNFRPHDPNIKAEENSHRPFIILYHGSLVARHGLDVAIDAFEIVRKSVPEARIVICGENTPYLESLLDEIRRRGRDQVIRYLGMRNRREIVEAIEQCDIGIIPNRKNIFTEINMPTRIFECLALGKPVIAPRTKGIQDYFEDEAMLFFEPDNTADLADKIVWSFYHKHQVAEVVQRGQTVYQKHRWCDERKRLITLVARLLENHSGARDEGLAGHHLTRKKAPVDL